jgi:ubiquitin carboxyl-terminal hydrolase 5/13
MGFSRNGCSRALYETKNSGVEAAMNWVMEHMGDANFNDPFVDPK